VENNAWVLDDPPCVAKAGKTPGQCTGVKGQSDLRCHVVPKTSDGPETGTEEADVTNPTCDEGTCGTIGKATQKEKPADGEKYCLASEKCVVGSETDFYCAFKNESNRWVIDAAAPCVAKGVKIVNQCTGTIGKSDLRCYAAPETSDGADGTTEKDVKATCNHEESCGTGVSSDPIAHPDQSKTTSSASQARYMIFLIIITLFYM